MRRPTPFRRISSPGERASREAELREHELQLTSPDLVDVQNGREIWAPNPSVSANHGGVATQKRAKLRRQIEEEKQLIADQKKNLGRIKILEEELSSQMAPREFFHQKKQDAKDYHKTVQHIVKVEQSPAYQAKARELQNLYRARSAMGAGMNPRKEDPDCADLSHLRK